MNVQWISSYQIKLFILTPLVFVSFLKIKFIKELSYILIYLLKKGTQSLETRQISLLLLIS